MDEVVVSGNIFGESRGKVASNVLISTWVFIRVIFVPYEEANEKVEHWMKNDQKITIMIRTLLNFRRDENTLALKQSALYQKFARV
ncbi:17060_t:CDS:2, partial [Funneliformis caledonium]